MTRQGNARLAGFAYLLYIVAGIAGMVLFGRAARGEGTAAKLASIAQHATAVRLTVVLTIVEFLCAVALAVTLYALTRDEDRDLARIAMFCRVAEGMIGAASAVLTLGLASLAEASAAAGGPDAATTALGALLLRHEDQSVLIAATCFALGSTLFCWLFLRARSIPVPLAWLGVFASVLLVVGLPLRIVGVLREPVSSFLWIPMLLFEVPFALWLLATGGVLSRRPKVTA